MESAGALRAPSWWTQGRRVACRTDDGARRVRSREGQIIWILLSSCQHLAEPIPDPRMREPRRAQSQATGKIPHMPLEASLSSITSIIVYSQRIRIRYM